MVQAVVVMLKFSNIIIKTVGVLGSGMTRVRTPGCPLTVQIHRVRFGQKPAEQDRCFKADPGSALLPLTLEL